MTTDVRLFSPQFTHTWENSTCTEGAENQVFATAAAAEGSCPSANTRGWGEDAPHMGNCSRRGSILTSKPCVCLADAAGMGLRPNPGLSCPCVAGGVEVPLPLGRQHLRAKGRRVQGDLLASSARGQVEFSPTFYPRHLCLSLQINSITLNPQTEQKELVLFKGNIKSL